MNTILDFLSLHRTCKNPSRRQATHSGDWGVSNRLKASQAGFERVAPYGVLLWRGVWSAQREPPLRHDVFDPLNSIACNASKSKFLTIRRERRIKYWFATRPRLGTQKPDDAGPMTPRNTISVDLHLGSISRAYSELINGDAFGFSGFNYDSIYRTRLAVQQLLIGALGNVAGARSALILGCQPRAAD